jgi:beta-lactamase class A
VVKPVSPEPWKSQPSHHRRNRSFRRPSPRRTRVPKSTSSFTTNRSQPKAVSTASPNPQRVKKVASDSKWSFRTLFQGSRTQTRLDRRPSRPEKPSPPTPPLKKRTKKRRVSPWVCAFRLLILGIGLGAIAGTILSAIDRSGYLYASESTPPAEVQASPSPPSGVIPPSLLLGQEITSLRTQLEGLAAKQPDLKPEAFFVDLDTKKYVDLEGATAISAASTIKVPILIAFLQDLDAGKVRLDETLTMTEELKASGSGDMQYQGIGKEYSALETITKMIIISDNSATNMIIDYLGGAETLNTRFQQWGLTTTRINNPLPDLEGTNTTSPQDLVRLMATVSQGEILSTRSRDRVFDIMGRTKTRTLLPQGLGEEARIAHKTGDIGSMVGDIGVIDMPNGKRYVGAVMVQRPHNNPQAQELIRQMSREVYQHFEQFSNTESFTSSPEGSEE